MCRVATCQKCSKATWAGCGNHVDQVMANIPQSRRCTCTAEPQSSGGGFSWLAKLFGR